MGRNCCKEQIFIENMCTWRWSCRKKQR